MSPSDDLRAVRDLYKETLLDNVIPWWMKNGIDHTFGGPTETITEDARVTSTIKPIWSVGRAMFVWSKLYNRIGQRGEWLAVADDIFEFIRPIGPRVSWYWPQSVYRNGTPCEPSQNIYNDGFILMGLAEYIRATGNPDAVEAAYATWETVQERMEPANAHLAGQTDLPDNAAAHGISMIFSLVFHQLGTALADPDILQASYDHATRVHDIFLDDEYGLVRESRQADGTPLDGKTGRTCIPGHAIESAWFGIHIFRDRNEQDRLDRAVEAVRSHVEAGWDEEYGGLFGSIDVETGEPLSPDHYKNMWPHTEALYALLLSYDICGEQWCLDWYDRMHEWSWQHFPNREHGEWHREVARDGSYPWDNTGPGEKPRKEPFHLPRMLINTVILLDRMTGQE
ncbi:MAG: AGE family epimerase/isomerase [Armatimonadota bacterium]